MLFITVMLFFGPRLNSLLALLTMGGAYLWLAQKTAGGDSAVAANWTKGTLIWGYLHLPPPEPLKHGPSEGLSGMVLNYLMTYPVWTLELVLKKIFWFFYHGRPTYSVLHNIYAVAQSGLLICLSLVGLWRHRLGNPATAFACAIVFLQTVSVSLTFADWDGRHLIRVMGPMILLASAVGWEALRRLAPGGFERINSRLG
jgi:hypothetical protein